MNIGILAAGAGGMYCGSCMRDNALALALQRLGHGVTLIPLYTPLRLDGDAADESVKEVFYGGVNVYLQHLNPVFRHMPRAVDWLLDRPWLLNVAGKIGAQTAPNKLADFTVDIISGEEGPALKELRRLVDFLKNTVKPRVVSLPNLMFIGLARVFRRDLGVPVVCELTGEDIFLDAMDPADRIRVQETIRRYVPDVDRFVATSRFYAERMGEYLGIAADRIDVVYPGISADYLTEPSRAKQADATPTVGYLARMCPEKGIDRLLDAFLHLRDVPELGNIRLRVGGYVGSRDEPFYKAQQDRAARAGIGERVTWHGEVTREQKIDLLDGSDVFSAPTAYAEAKGMFLLEAWARGLPVVQPAHGSFPELIEQTGGGLLVPPCDATALADGIAELLRDPARRKSLGDRGREAVRASFTDTAMAESMLKVYQDVQ